MKYRTMLSVDLEPGVITKQRTDFGAALARFKWAKVPGLKTVWHCSWAEGTAREAISAAVQHQVATAAREARIKTYHAAVHTGTDDPEAFTP